MMKYKYFFIAIPLLLFLSHLNGESVTFYTKGNIKLKAYPEFGRGMDWGSIYGINHAFVMAPDGSLFVANKKQHEIYKFSKSGQLICKFGQKGRGPGDLYVPGSLAILDNKYLVVCEGAETRRISIFNLEGKFVRTLKTQYPNFRVVALKKNTIAYFSITFQPGKKFPSKNTQIVSLMDVESNKEKIVYSIDLPENGTLGKKNGVRFKISSLGGFCGSVVLTATKDRNLIVGVSNKPVINVYSTTGQLVHSFQLNLSPSPVTAEYIQSYKRYKLKTMREGNDADDSSREIADLLESFSFKPVFCDTLPLYHNIFVDADGNILVFKWTKQIENRIKDFQVYSADGKYLCSSQLDPGAYDFIIKSNVNNIIFSGKDIFGIFYVYDSAQDETCLRIVKAAITY